jgi:hypothetical protein
VQLSVRKQILKYFLTLDFISGTKTKVKDAGMHSRMSRLEVEPDLAKSECDFHYPFLSSTFSFPPFCGLISCMRARAQTNKVGVRKGHQAKESRVARLSLFGLLHQMKNC